MRIIANRGNRLHAPENTLPALLSGYTGGADVLGIDLQFTKDGKVVLIHDSTTDRVTGMVGRVADLTLAELRKFDFSKTFQPRYSRGFEYYFGKSHRLKVEVLADFLELLPDDVELLIQLGHESTGDPQRRVQFITKVLAAVGDHGIESRSVLYSKDPENLRLVRSLGAAHRIATCVLESPPENQLELMVALGADGLVTHLEMVFAGNTLTSFGEALQTTVREEAFKVGAILYPARSPAVFTETEWRALKERPFIWGLATDSMQDVAFTRRSFALVDEAFAGNKLDRERFALGYAKANGFAEVTQSDGIHVHIDPYPPFSQEPTDVLEKRLASIEAKLTDVAKDWPYYSGGGLGYVPGIRGNFAAEVNYAVETVAQATTLEMAVLNVDPGAHQSSRPTSFRGKDSFYDPHGAPPYVGVEHDENDGYRINWNLGSEYDSNQYGKPVGDGATPRAGRLRLERRGAYFAAYYRNEVDAGDWVCCGVACNYTLNPLVYLRCVGKRWLQESEADPLKFEPVIPNHFFFFNLKIDRFPKPI